MSGANHDPFFSRARVTGLLLILLTFWALYGCYRLIQPFIPAVAFAIALAVATTRPYLWLKRRVRGRNIPAAIAVVCVTVLILAPVTYLTTYIVQTAVQNINDLRANNGFDRLRSELQDKAIVGTWVADSEKRFNLGEQIARMGQGVAARAGGVLAGSFGVLTQLVIMLFVLFFLYRDGDEAREAVRRLLPLSPSETDRMLDRIGVTIRAMVNGSLIVAACQAILATAIYAVLGVPLFVLWGSTTFFAAFVPVFGTSLVWIPVCAYLLITGAWVKAAILVGWSALVIGSVDNLLYPYLVGDELQVHTLLTFFAVLGGVSVFGPSGILLGPMVLAVTLGLLEVWSGRLGPIGS
jgi:predicted PurR-regulated permease PerM